MQEGHCFSIRIHLCSPPPKLRCRTLQHPCAPSQSALHLLILVTTLLTITINQFCREFHLNVIIQ